MLITAVREVGAWEATIALFHGDHGLSLGEYGVAGKVAPRPSALTLSPFKERPLSPQIGCVYAPMLVDMDIDLDLGTWP